MRVTSHSGPASQPAARIEVSTLDEARAAAVRAYLRWRGKLPLTIDSYRFWRDERGVTRSTLERTIQLMAARGEITVTERGGCVTIVLSDGGAR